MVYTLTGFRPGSTYHFLVRAVDCHNRLGPFSDPASIQLRRFGDYVGDITNTDYDGVNTIKRPVEDNDDEVKVIAAKKRLMI